MVCGHRHETWAPTRHAYADEHPAPMSVKWRHRTTIGHVVALVRRHGCLDAVGEITADAGALAELADALVAEGLRWSSSTEQRGRSGPLVIRELTLAPASAVASVGLPDVRFSTSDKDMLPTWVRDALQRRGAGCTIGTAASCACSTMSRSGSTVRRSVRRAGTRVRSFTPGRAGSLP